MNFNISNLFTLGFFLSQLYLWSSGIPQPAHIILIITCITFLIKNYKISYKHFSFLSIFLLYLIIVNFFYTMINFGDLSYVTSILYWIFNSLLFLCLSNLSFQSYTTLKANLRKFIFLSIVITIIIWALGIGRYDFFPRYNGFFNDPNQMAFWFLTVCSIGLILVESKFSKLIVFIGCSFIILLTMSRSATVGLILVTLGYILQQKGSKKDKILVISFVFITVSFAILGLYKYGFLDSILNRFIEGINEDDKQISDRGLDNILRYPQYSILGAGQGGYFRFSETGHEIHSTWFGIVFYYGLIGLTIFLCFLRRIYIGLTLSEKFLFLGPMFYGFSTYSARTIIFWIFITVFYLHKKYRGSE